MGPPELVPLRPRPVARPWGGRQIAAYLGRDLPSGRIGELIQAADDTPVDSGPFAGEPIRSLVERYGPSLLGAGATMFPVSTRFIDAPHWGPIHVHLPNRSGRPLAGAEIWHVLAAHEGSAAVLGLRQPPPERDALLQAPLEGLVARRALRAGETVLIPPGLAHAVGGGALLFAIQLTGGRTVRLTLDGAGVDEGGLATPADLEAVDWAAAALDGHATAAGATLPNGRGLARWAGLELERAGLLAPHRERYAGDHCALYTPIAGELELTGAAGAVTLPRGQTALVSATAGDVELRPAGALGVCTLLKIRLPVSELAVDRPAVTADHPPRPTPLY